MKHSWWYNFVFNSCCCGFPQLNTVRVTQYVHLHLYIHTCTGIDTVPRVRGLRVWPFSINPPCRQPHSVFGGCFKTWIEWSFVGLFPPMDYNFHLQLMPQGLWKRMPHGLWKQTHCFGQLLWNWKWTLPVSVGTFDNWSVARAVGGGLVLGSLGYCGFFFLLSLHILWHAWL